MKILSNFVSKMDGLAFEAVYVLKHKIISKLQDNSGNWLDESFKYILAVVVGLLFLGGIYTLIKSNVLPTLELKVKKAFDFS